MCDPLMISAASTVKPPERRLAALIERDLGIVVEPRELRLFLRANWKTVAALAHGIHEQEANHA